MDYLDELKSMDLYDEFYKLKCQKDSILWSGFEKNLIMRALNNMSRVI